MGFSDQMYVDFVGMDDQKVSIPRNDIGPLLAFSAGGKECTNIMFKYRSGHLSVAHPIEEVKKLLCDIDTEKDEDYIKRMTDLGRFRETWRRSSKDQQDAFIEEVKRTSSEKQET